MLLGAPKPQSPFNAKEYDRAFWAWIFGQMIRGCRINVNRSIEEAALLAGMETSEWTAIEGGQVPTTGDQLDAIRAALDMTWIQMWDLMTICNPAFDLYS
jgi:hypothetical protein